MTLLVGEGTISLLFVFIVIAFLTSMDKSWDMSLEEMHILESAPDHLSREMRWTW